MGVLSALNGANGIALRKAQPEDAGILARIGRETFCETFGHLYRPEDLAAYLKKAYDEEEHRAALADHALYHVVAERDGEIAGFAKAGPCKLPVDTAGERAYELYRLYVRRVDQRQGIGALLMRRVLEHARRTQHDTLYLGMWEHNEQARGFYARFGLLEVGEYRFYVGQHEDRELILRMTL